MIEGKAEDVLWIVSSPGGAPSGTMILGLPLLRRVVLAAERAGFGRIVVEETAAGGVRSLVEETRVQVLGPMDSVPDLGSGRLVVLPGSVIPQVRWLRDLRQRTVEPRRLMLDPGCAAVLETGDLHEAVSILRRRGARAPLDALSALFPAAALLPPGGERFEITGAQDLGRAEDWLLQSLIKDTEGFMSRHVERRISLALSRRLASTRVTPNSISGATMSSTVPCSVQSLSRGAARPAPAGPSSWARRRSSEPSFPPPSSTGTRWRKSRRDLCLRPSRASRDRPSRAWPTPWRGETSSTCSCCWRLWASLTGSWHSPPGAPLCISSCWSPSPERDGSGRHLPQLRGVRSGSTIRESDVRALLLPVIQCLLRGQPGESKRRE